ncbi:hypothetical protein CXB51_012736 [Gossypium anomalum]|uniref:Laccase n=1 Tax=Gossypium anomalum TaxID=47600 RepID=A0A8J6D1A5_9ROSI|nr:hypothetical protein CXB51_012736 [Gossypium anomalum]
MAAVYKSTAFVGVFVFTFVTLCLFPLPVAGITRHYKSDIKLQNVARLCHSKSIVTFPGPCVRVREGNQLSVKVVSHVPNNITIHWYGSSSLKHIAWRSTASNWMGERTGICDSVSHTKRPKLCVQIQNCMPKRTLFWHAHISWLRATVYGPLIILPRLGVPYPFPKPYKEVPIIFGEWFNADTEAIISQTLQTGGGPNVSDAYTINGHPGPFYNCSAKDTFKLKVKPGKTYLLLLINVALNDQLFFGIANDTLTVVEADAVYVKPFETEAILLASGQTTNVLLKTKPTYPNGSFFMAARPYVTGSATFNSSTIAGILEYELSPNSLPSSISVKNLSPFTPNLPALSNTSFVANFANKLRGLATVHSPASVPQYVDKQFLFTVGLGTSQYWQNRTCQGPNGTKFAAAVNNVSFTMPTTALLQAQFFGKSHGVYKTDFPREPKIRFDYTGTPPDNTMVNNGTKLLVLPFKTNVELIMQDTSILGAESHPLHLHGYNFFVVGQGFGNFDPQKDPNNFNLIDPVERNTVGVPAGGWVVIRFVADNPGVWFMLCHIDAHQSWGRKMAWIVLDGDLPNQKLSPPPDDLPMC